MSPTDHLRTMLDGLIWRGRAWSRRWTARIGSPGRRNAPAGEDDISDLTPLARLLLSGRGQSSGIRMATELLEAYAELDRAGRLRFMCQLFEEFGPDRAQLMDAWRQWQADESRRAFSGLVRAIEPPRQELFRRLNMAPMGTAALVAMRADLLAMIAGDPNLAPKLGVVDDDLFHLLQSWFNRGFLVMRRIDWSSPADLLERIVRYEAVHNIATWDELRDRLLPEDRRCYAFFHPAMADEPLIFVEVALGNAVAGSIQDVLAHDRSPLPVADARVAIFYSISNCQAGLAGISFGHFLIKQVVQQLSRELPLLETFATLSPVPRFGRWLRAEAEAGNVAAGEYVGLLDQPEALADLEPDSDAAFQLLSLALHYLMEAKDGRGLPVDPVARFHLGNGARLENLRWMGDRSARGLAQSAGFMVNYLYDLQTIEDNHEAFAGEGRIALGEPIRRLARESGIGKGTGTRHAGDNLHDLSRPLLGRAR